MLNNQIFIEGENHQLYVYVHLDKFKFKKREASKIMDIYIRNFAGDDFEKINILFWDKNLAGEHLSLFRKTCNEAIGRILKGARCMVSCFDFKENSKIINNPQVV